MRVSLLAAPHLQMAQVSPPRQWRQGNPFVLPYGAMSTDTVQFSHLESEAGEHDRLSPLQQLAHAYGIAPSYISQEGDTVWAEDDTLRFMLERMGMDKAALSNSHAAMEARQKAQASRGIEPVTVLKGSQLKEDGLWLTFHLPQERWQKVADEGLDWTIELEDGSQKKGRLTPGDFANVREHQVNDIEGAQFETGQVHLEDLHSLPQGYHKLTLRYPDGGSQAQRVIITPDEAYIPPVLKTQRAWGPAIQLYAMRAGKPHDFGMGDFSTLQDFASWMAREGAGTVGLNPLNLLNPHYPLAASPYSPSSRLFLNPLYIDAAGAPGFTAWQKANPERWEAIQKQAAAANQKDKIDYETVRDLKFETLKGAYEEFEKALEIKGGVIGRVFSKADPSLKHDVEGFKQFQEDRGLNLRLFGLHQALQERFEKKPWFWWPEEFQKLSDEKDWHAVEHQLEHLIADKADREALLERARFHEYLQWVADSQLGAVQKNSGLPLGLYQDLTVGVEYGGFDAWKDRSNQPYMRGISVGCPPDPLGPKGQNWGSPPLDPNKLRELGYEPFVEMMRQQMRNAGILRIDHAAQLMRLFWIPEGKTAGQGAYIQYNLDELMGIIALESQRNKCLIIGEDLGTVPPEVTTALKDWNTFSYKLPRWERNWEEEGGPYTPPEDIEPLAAATLSTHDTTTLRGLMTGWLFEELERLGMMDAQERDERIAGDEPGNRLLLDTLKERGLLTDGVTLERIREGDKEAIDAYSLAFHKYLAQAASKVTMFQVEDVLGIEQQMNVPGTRTEGGKIVRMENAEDGIPSRLNWFDRLPLTVDELKEHPMMKRVLDAFRDERGKLDTQA